MNFIVYHILSKILLIMNNKNNNMSKIKLSLLNKRIYKLLNFKLIFKRKEAMRLSMGIFLLAKFLKKSKV